MTLIGDHGAQRAHETRFQAAKAWARVAFVLGVVPVAAPHERIRNLSMSRRESLKLARRFEASHHLLAQARGLVRIFRPVVQSFVLPMLDAQAQFRIRRRVAAQLVREDHPRAAVALEQLAHQPFGLRLVGAALHQDLEHRTVLIDSPPQPMLGAVDRHDHLVQVPLVAAPERRRANAPGDRPAELGRPAPHRFVRQLDPRAAATSSSTMRRLSGKR